jgi:hypothetical protein
MLIVAMALLLQAQPKPLPKDPSTFVKVADNAKLPALVLDADGNAYVAFVHNGNVEVAVSSDGGATFSAPVIAFNESGRDAALANRGPRIAVDNQKRVYVSAPLNLAPPKDAVVNDLYYCVSTDKGKTFGKPYMLNDAAKSGAESVHAAACGPGDFQVAWLDVKAGKPPALCYSKFGADGKRSGKVVVVNANPCEKCPPAIAVDGKGNPCVAWRESNHDAASKEHRQIYMACSTDGGRSFAAAQRLNSVDSGISDCPNEGPALAAAADGKQLAAAWMDRRDLERDANIYWAFGPPGKFARDTDPHDDRRYIQRRPTLAIDADGVVWCAWEDGRVSPQRVFFTNSKDPANIPLGDVKEMGSSAPALSFGGGKVAIAYQSGENIGFRILK